MKSLFRSIGLSKQENEPSDVLKAKADWKKANFERKNLTKLFKAAFDSSTTAMKSWQGVCDQLILMAEDGSNPDLALLTNIAEAHKQNLESMTVYNDTLKYKVVNALLDIEKQSDADTKKAKKEYKKAFQKYAKKRHESEKKNDDSEIQEELATLETTVNRTKTTLMELWESVKRDRMAEVLQSLFTNFEAEYIMAREVCNNFTESSPSVLRCAQACGLKEDISIPISTIGEPTNVEHLGGGGGVNILESDNRLDLRDANVTQQLQQDSIAYALPSSRNEGMMENYEVDRHVESHSSRITSVDSRQSDGEEKLKKKPPPLPARPPPDSPPDLKSARRSQRGSTRKEAKGTFSEKNGNKSSSMQDVRGLVPRLELQGARNESYPPDTSSLDDNSARDSPIEVELQGRQRDEMEASAQPVAMETHPSLAIVDDKLHIHSRQEANESFVDEENPNAVWEAFRDDDGNVYFYNKVTNSTQWDRPEGFDGEPDDD
mmetsp:Transcript_32437/g.72848  ORF Transcript_32437/g.72848 Transcript_32437/m.72848 type:complete len:490 (-) Transcript_32437:728-2197(-)